RRNRQLRIRAVDKPRKLLQTAARRSALPELHSPGERRIRDADVRSRALRLATSWCNQGSRSRSDKRELLQFLSVFLERLRSPARCRARARAARVHGNRRRGSGAVRGAKEAKAPDPDASDKATSGEAGAITTANNATESAAGQFETAARDCRMISPC